MRQMKKVNSEDPLILTKEKILHGIYIIFAILAIPLAGSSVARTTLTGWRWAYTFHLILAAVPFFVIIFSKRISYKFKVYIALTALLLTVLNGVLSFGYLGNAKIFIIIIVLLAGLFLGKKQGYLALLTGCLIMILAALLYTTQTLQYDFDINKYILKYSTWLTMVTVVIAVSAGSLEIITRVFQAHVKTTQKIAESEKRFHTIIQQAADAVYLYDMQGRIVEVNEQSCKQTGYSSEELLQKTVMDMDSSYPSLEQLQKLWNDMLPEQSVKIESSHLRKDGSKFPVEVSISTIDLDNGKHTLGFARDISERKKAEQQLKEDERILREQNEEYLTINEELTESNTKIKKINQELEAAIEKAEESEERFRKLSNLTYEGILIHKMGICQDVNQSLERIFGYTRDEIIGTYVIDLILPEYQEITRKHMIEKYTKSYEVVAKRKDGSAIPIEIIAQNTVWNNEEIRVAAVRDITERKKAEKALHESEEKYRMLFEKANDAIFLMDGDVFIDCNPQTLKMYGCNYDEIVGKTPYDYSPEFQPDGSLSKIKATELITESLKGEIKTFEWIHTRKNGELFNAEVSLNRVAIKNKDYIQAIVRDITERKLAEKALQESNEKYRRLANATFEGIGYTYKGQIIETNNRIIEMYGYTEDEFKKLELKNLVHPDDLSLVMEHIRKNDETPYEHRAIRKDGSVFYIEARGKTVEVDNKIMRLTILRDITERKNYEITLAASELKFRNIFNSSSDGIIVIDFDKNILAVNQLILNYLRMDEAQVLSKKVDEFITKQDIPEIQKRIKAIENGKSTSAFEIEIILGKNLTLPVEINSIGIDFENQKAILTILRDISERKQMQHKLMQTIIQTEEKERSHFAKELHDGLGPLLSTMNIYIGILKDSRDEVRRETAIERIQASVEEAILSIRQISNSLSPHVLQNFGLSEAISNFCSRLADIEAIKIKFTSNLEERLDRNIELSLFRVVVELINNSIKYSGAGLIKIVIHLEKYRLTVDYWDNGKGFNIEETLKSTRSMGLHNIYNRVNSLNGKVELTSQPGKGMKAGIKFKIKESKWKDTLN